MPHMGDRVSAVAQPSSAPAPSPYVAIERERWSSLRDTTPLTLDDEDLARLRGLGEPIDLAEVEEVYLPLSRLLSLQVTAAHERHRATSTFLGEGSARVPFVIGVAGSVAVGKSTTSRVLRELLARWPHHPQVELVTTDGFLLPNA
jgi:type I pantothenate kinase